MGEVNFYLKKPENDRKQKDGTIIKSSGKSLIVLYKRYRGQRLVFSTGETINPNSWNKSKQRVKNNSATKADGSQYLNDFLNDLQNKCNTAYTKCLINGIPNPEAIKLSLFNFINKIEETEKEKGELFKLIDRFINNEIKNRGRSKSSNTIKAYKTLMVHLREYESVHGEKLTFESINLDFYYKYVDFLSKRSSFDKKISQVRQALKLKMKKPIDLGENAIGKDIAVLKVFMAEAFDFGYTSNIQFKHKKFAVPRAVTDAVYLKEKELSDLYKFDLSANKQLEQVKDLFIFGCFTGLRYQDYSTIKPENIIQDDNEYFIKLITQKTKELVIIPCNPIVLEIFKKYENSPNRLPVSISNQKFNDYIKRACKTAGLTEKGRLSTDLNMELWECIASHTARRSFATNLYLEGFPTLDIMKITSHKSETAFLGYIKFNKLDAAKRLSAHMKKNWSSRMLRVAS